MPKGTIERVWILVKAYPQESRQYEETVCCAGISEDGERLLRLYPIRFRHLPKDERFKRFDLVEMELITPREDLRPESNKVVEDSIHIVSPQPKTTPKFRTQLWARFVSSSFEALKDEQQATGKSLGIIAPDSGSVRFKWRKTKDTDDSERELASDLRQQISLLEPSLKHLPDPEYLFFLEFKSAGKRHGMQIHDWEVQASYANYLRLYGDQALTMMKQKWESFENEHLHLIMGTQGSRPKQFMIIGLLRSQIDPGLFQADAQLF